MKRNKNLSKLQPTYLFQEINKKKRSFLEKNPLAKIISLGIGDTTEPLTPLITKRLEDSARSLGERDSYIGYGEERGDKNLRKKIAELFYQNIVNEDEIFISDGAKCDIGRLQIMFGQNIRIAVQDPSYPVYVDGSIIVGAVKKFKDIIYMECSPENNFFPNLSKIKKKVDIIYFCSPNNPTGSVSTREQLEELILFAKNKKSIIIFDAAYSEYIDDNKLPKSIYEVKGSKEVAIEVNSFSKSLGFTGVRLGWCVVPKDLTYDDGYLIWNDWNRIVSTIFNGASNIAQRAVFRFLNENGIREIRETVSYYKKNAQIIKQTLDDLGIENYGGKNSPYIWVRIKGKKSWEIFDEFLEKYNIIVTPGSGFGPSGEGFVRISSYGHREDIEEACKRLQNIYGK
ncbi:MAG: LL-diaminopimelate aminotransferase [Candidatus Pacearchaeota archaeon]